MGVPLDKLDTPGTPQLLFLDGANPPDAAARASIGQVLRSGGTVLVWSADPQTLRKLNALLPASLELAARAASSLLPASPSPLLSGLSPANLYFSEQRPPTITQFALAGPLIAQSRVLLRACNTDWLKWNKQPEYAKTAMVLRSEREAKLSGVVLAEASVGSGRLLLTTLPSASRLVKGEAVSRTLLANLGVLLGPGMDSGKALLRTGLLVRALASGFFPVASVIDPAASPESDPAKPWKPAFQESGTFDLTKLGLSGSPQNAAALLSFWVHSPRSLEDLLLEPDLPVVNFEVAQNDAVQVWLNDRPILEKLRVGPIEGGKATAAALKLRQGWNHFLIRLSHSGGGWEFTGALTCNQPDFLHQLDSAVERP
jgi:beta-galactosidase